MTVSKFGGAENVTCVWFDGLKEKTAIFSAASLKKVPARARGSAVRHIRGDF